MFSRLCAVSGDALLGVDATVDELPEHMRHLILEPVHDARPQAQKVSSPVGPKSPQSPTSDEEGRCLSLPFFLSRSSRVFTRLRLPFLCIPFCPFDVVLLSVTRSSCLCCLLVATANQAGDHAKVINGSKKAGVRIREPTILVTSPSGSLSLFLCLSSSHLLLCVSCSRAFAHLAFPSHQLANNV